MTASASIKHSINSEETTCSAAVYSPLIAGVLVCKEINTECIHALPCESTCYCAHHNFYL